MICSIKEKQSESPDDEINIGDRNHINTLKMEIKDKYIIIDPYKFVISKIRISILHIFPINTSRI